MLIGQRLDLSFLEYSSTALPPTLLGLVAVWGVAVALYRGTWIRECPAHIAAVPVLNPWQCGKGILVTLIVMGLFLFAPFPRDIVAMGAAGVLLMSRKMATRHILGFVDWHLLVLFAGLFVVNHCVETSGLLTILMNDIRGIGIEPQHPGWLFAITVVLSNIVSNVPATMLLLPVATHPVSGAVLALSSTLAGNLIIVGSIANIIVVDQAQRMGVEISWRTHAKMGIPVTIITLAIAAAWLAIAG
jgi:Na+/H+ antiporter NhaD/arsenite permease-like protein